MPHIDALMPSYDFTKVNTRLVRGVSSEGVYDALQALTCAEIKLLAPLFYLRLLPDKLRGRPATFATDGLFLAEFKKVGFAIPREERPKELVLTLIGKLWRYDSLDTVRHGIGEAAFCAFAEPEYIKVATNFAVAAKGGDQLLSTETRIAATCERSLRLFSWYWRAIRFGSGLLRDSMLAGIARRAEAERGATGRRKALLG